MSYSTFPTITEETEATRRACGETIADETPAEEALRALACWLGAGGYNAPTVDAKVFEEKIRWGVDYAIKTAARAAMERAAQIAEGYAVDDWIGAEGARRAASAIRAEMSKEEGK